MLSMNKPNKILTLDLLAKKVAQLKAEGLKVVLCHGTFDLMHIGHIRHFEQASKLGDVLIVTLTPDQFVNKGSNRPVFTGILRTEAIASLEMVDYVALNDWPTAVETIGLLRPDIYCKGGEYRQKQVDAESALLPEIAAADEHGVKVEYTDDIVFSSSNLLNRHFSPFPSETDAWLEGFRERYSADEIIGHLDDLRHKKVLVVGEAIIDEYVYCTAIGKSTKDPVLACQYHSTEAFAGGSLAVANHVADFCDSVDLITCLGETERREDFVRDALLPNVNPVFVTQSGSPTIHKRRHIDQYTQNKLFELYIMDDRPLKGGDEDALLQILEERVADYDVVIAIDYGHGMLVPSCIEVLCKKASFLAVNTQSNAGNRGFNPISKYRRADYVCLANHEVHIETRMREGDMRDLMLEVTARIECSRFTVTQGKSGSLHYETGGGFTEAPALATQVTDRVGAGDAVLALTSLLVESEAPWDIIGFVGNAAGAQIVAELGNRLPIRQIALAKSIISLMK
jgi:rfaE bifunctional protein nucleotidyltransferase chain/domain